MDLRRSFFRTLVYCWAGPYTVTGLLVGLLLGGRVRWVAGVFEIHGPAVAWVLQRLPVSAAAITVGHTVLGRTLEDLDGTRSHERVHVRQFERWGLLMGPAYVGASCYQALRGRNFYRDNPFEIEAFAHDQRFPSRRTADRP